MAKLYNDNHEIDFKIVNDESKDFSNEVTQKPIEGENNIADHINHKPLELSFNIFIGGDDAQDKREKLQKMRNSDEVFTYLDVKELNLYENMAITGLNIDDTKRSKNGFFGSLSLMQVRLVEQVTTVVDLGPDPVTENQPQKESEEPDKREPEKEEVEENNADERMKSTLYQMTGGE